MTIALMLSLAVLSGAAAAQNPDRPGVLILAHGGKPEWNDRVTAIARAVDADQPTEVAFGMATRPNIQAAIDRLAGRGVKRIVAVPLFVSSHSSVFTSTEYLLGLRAEMPKDLLVFAKMSHGKHGSHGAGHAEDNTRPVQAQVPISMTGALDHHPLVASILADRARSLSREPAQEAVIVVAHGPVPDADNARWLGEMKLLADDMRRQSSFAAIDYLTVRDDAGKAVKEAATAELRALVQARVSEGRRVLVVPLLLSYSGVEQGIRERLQGLDYVMADRGLTPDDRVVEWVRQVVAGR